MNGVSRRRLRATAMAGLPALMAPRQALALTGSLKDVGGAMLAPSPATIYIAREIVMVDEAQPAAGAVAVVNRRILPAASLAEVTANLRTQPHTINRRSADHELVPGFIALHDNPVLAAHSLKFDDEIGTISPGKRAKVTVLADNLSWASTPCRSRTSPCGAR